MNAHQVLEWIKSNLVIVIFVVVMIAAPIAMYFVAGGMNAKVKQEVNKRAVQLTQMDIKVDVNGQQVVPTEDLLKQYEQVTKTLADDAAAVQKKALSFNRKDRDVLMPGVFPEPPSYRLESIPKDFHERLVGAYDQLLKDVRAGTPPELETLRIELEGLRNRFITQDLKKELTATLEPEEAERLKKMLSEARLGMYKQAAGNIGLYASVNGLGVPESNQAHIPTPAEMFIWQWQYWATEDVLRAIALANKSATTVADAPVKQLIGIVIQDLPGVASTEATSSGANPGRASGGFGAEGAGAAPPPPGDGGDAGGAAGMAANPKAPITRNYASSFSGLITNPLFDVLTIDFAIVVETARLPEVLDTISRYNFNTITNLTVEATDPFAATEQGYYFGGEPVCLATIRMETVWLREWTKAFMPPALRAELGIAPDAPPVPGDVPPPPPPPSPPPVG